MWGEGCPFQVQDEILILYIFGVHFPVLVSFAEPAFGFIVYFGICCWYVVAHIAWKLNLHVSAVLV